jgi:hypothetical protein
MTSLGIIVAVLLRNALTRQASASDEPDGNCQPTKKAFLKQTCGAAVASK